MPPLLPAFWADATGGVLIFKTQSNLRSCLQHCWLVHLPASAMALPAEIALLAAWIHLHLSRERPEQRERELLRDKRGEMM